jgi:hypothetical protein
MYWPKILISAAWRLIDMVPSRESLPPQVAVPMDMNCLFCHKCTTENHAFGLQLKGILERCGVELLIDPFRPGDETDTRMDSFEFDSVLFLWSPESAASEACQRELRTARRRSSPLFVAVDSEAPTRTFKKRILWVRPPDNSSEFAGSVADLGKAIRYRVGFSKDLRRLQGGMPPDESGEAAQRIALDFDRTILAENVSMLAKRYFQTIDYTTRYWIAIALGAAGTAKASRMLTKLPSQDHPLVQEGIRQALEMITHGT